MSTLFLLNNNEVLDLFEIKMNDYEGYFRFHGSKNFDKNIIFQNKEYLYIPCELSNLEYNSEGPNNRPTLVLSNINNYITNLIKDRNNFIGKRFYRKKILAKDLDDVNFGGVDKNLLGVKSFTSFISNDSFLIQKKSFENKEKVEFVLSNIVDFEGVSVPSRKIFNNACQWIYRGCGCNYGKITGYTGPTISVSEENTETLLQINTRLSLTSNLKVFLQPSGQIYSGTTTVKKPSDGNTLTFDVLTGWTNNGTHGSPSSISLINSAKKYENKGRMGDKNGVLFTRNNNGNFDGLLINENFNTNISVFYVCEMVDKVLTRKEKNKISIAGYQRGLTSKSTSSWFLGYQGLLENVAMSKNSAGTAVWISKGNTFAWDFVDKPRVYGAISPSSSSGETVFIKNGNPLTSQTGFINSPDTLGINLSTIPSAEHSEIVVYEVIIYNTLLTEEQYKEVSFYLARKYNLPIDYVITRTKDKNAADFFANRINLGLPMADENNKMFLQSAAIQSVYTNSENYGLNDLTYRGDYSRKTNYAFGDFVKIEPDVNFNFNDKFQFNNNELPARFFVCVDVNGSLNEHPFNYTNKWVEDKCSKTLNGCSMRFNGLKTSIPFGGFPATVNYEYKMPS